jgi:hypothetical protein
MVVLGENIDGEGLMQAFGRDQSLAEPGPGSRRKKTESDDSVFFVRGDLCV